MGTRGPTRTPTTKLKLANSRLVKDREETEPVFTGEIGECPDWLDKESRAEWACLIPQLEGAGVLQSADWNAFARLCKARARWKELEMFVDDHGTSYESHTGQIRTYPEVLHLNQLMGHLTRLECEFGLTPASRSRVVVKPTTKKSRKGRFFTGTA